MTAWSLLLAKLKLSDKVHQALAELMGRLGMDSECFQATGYMGKNAQAF